MLFGLIDSSSDVRRRRAEARALRSLRRRTKRDEDGVPYVAGAYVVKDGSTRPRPVKLASPEKVAAGPSSEPTEEDRASARLFLQRRQAAAAVGTVIGSAEGTMSFPGYSAEGPDGADLRAGVARRRERLFGADPGPSTDAPEPTGGRGEHRYQNLLYG